MAAMPTKRPTPAHTILDLGDDYWFKTDPKDPAPWRDPYLRWAVLTNFRSLQGRNNEFPAQLSFIVERTETSTSWQGLNGLGGVVTVEPVFSQALSNGSLSRFATLRVKTAKLSDDELKEKILQLLKHKDIKRIQLGYPRGRPRGQGEQKPPPNPPDRGIAHSGPQIAEVVIGVIDDGCPFAHPDLCDEFGHTRLAALWLQSTFDPVKVPWRFPTDLGYGRTLDRAAMNDFIDAAQPGDHLDELLCYQEAFAFNDKDAETGRTWLKPNRALLARASHGGSVMAVAAGRLPNLHDERPKYETGDDLHGARGDAASRCPLIFVDMPRELVEISSGRWLPVTGLDGLRFILQQARACFVGPGGARVPVVANMSSGSTAGAHSGEAMFERAMDELLAADEHFAITLAAGNSRDAESHARLDVPGRGSATVGVFVPASQPYDTLVEFWLPPCVDTSTVEFSVTSPEGEVRTVSRAVPEAVFAEGIAATDAAEQKARKRTAALMFFPKVVQATDRTMVLLAVCGTVHSTRRLTLAASGPWQVTVSHRGASELRVQAWIERDEIVFGTRRDQAARFFAMDGDCRNTKALVRKTNTLSNIATGEHAFAVAGYRGQKVDGPMADYSGAPPGRWQAQDRYLPFAARADAGHSHPGVRAPGNRGNVVRRLNGTSVAAPQAARYVANQMAAGKTRAEIEAALPPKPAPLPAAGSGAAPKIDPRDGRLRL
jgi:hypothetical protein